MKTIIVLFLIATVGLYFLPPQTSGMTYIEENTSSHSENENINEEDLVFSKKVNIIFSVPSHSYQTSSTIYESPVLPVLIGPPKHTV